jgi:hypothetical protein
MEHSDGVNWRRIGRRCVTPVLVLPAVAEAVLFLAEKHYAQGALVDQVLDAALSLAALAIVATFLLAVCVPRVRPQYRAAWWLAVVASAFAVVVAAAAFGSPVPEHEPLAYVTAVTSLAAVVVVLLSRPLGVASPGLPVGKASVTALAGVLSIGSLQAWNAVAYAPSQQEPSVSTSSVVTAVEDGHGGTRVSATITAKNSSSVPATVVASQYTLWALDVGDADWQPHDGLDPLDPQELGDNGAVTRTVIGTGIVFRPYQRIPGNSDAQFEVALSTRRPETAFRLSVVMYSARGDRLVVEQPAEVTPCPWSRNDQVGAQLGKYVVPGSRLRAFTTGRVVVYATWHHSPAGTAPRLDVYFNGGQPIDNQAPPKVLGLQEYRLSRQFYEWTTFRTPPPPAGVPTRTSSSRSAPAPTEAPECSRGK